MNVATKPTRPEVKPDVARYIEAVTKARLRRRTAIITSSILLGVALIAAWEIVSGTLVEPFWISSPGDVFGRLAQDISTGAIWPNISITLREAFAGFVVGSVAGLAAGVGLGLFPSALAALNPYLVAGYSLPKIVLAPLLILYVGIGFEMKAVLAGIIAFFLVFFNTVEAVRATDPELVGVVRVAGASRWQLLRVVYFPSALNGILVGVKIAAPLSLQGALLGEILASNRGMGYQIQFSASQFDITGVIAGMFVITIVAVLVDQGVRAVVSRTQRWRGTESTG